MDPRNNAAGAVAANIANAAASAFASSIGGAGNIAAANGVSGGIVGVGLQNIAYISNSIRTGSGSLPPGIGSSVDQGTYWVLNQVGISTNAVQALSPFNSGVASQGLSTAQQVFQQTQLGQFKLSDIPLYITDLQNLLRLSNGVYNPNPNLPINPTNSPSPYAEDLIARAPKFKFLFLVQFVTAAGYSSLDNIMRGLAFVVKKSTRPKVTFQTENVNYYNYRTKVIIKTEYEEMSMSFHDDTLNNATSFYAAYLQAMSPIANLTPSQSCTQDAFEQLGMNFVGNILVTNQGTPTPINTYAASIGPLNNDNKQGIFKEITLYHVFDVGNTVNVYHFINPRITQLVPDDVDMSVGNEGNELSIVFTYETVYVETVTMQSLDGTFRGAQSDAIYQLRYNGASSSGPNTNGINPYGPLPIDNSNNNLLNPQTIPGIINGLGGTVGGNINNSLGDVTYISQPVPVS